LLIVKAIGEFKLFIKLSDYVIQFIADQGVKHVFMVPGGGAMHLNDSLGKCQDIEFVCNLHEQASAIAAEAYAQVTNNLGVALVTTGPGGTNAVTGVAGAWLDSAPCMIISGQVKRSDLKHDSGLRQLGVQEIDIVSIVKPITKYAVTIMEPSSIRYHLEKASFFSRSGRPGPVWIDIPLDVQAALINKDTLMGFEPSQESIFHAGDETLIDKVVKVVESLNQADRPIILVGNGVRSAGAQVEILQVIENLEIPIMTTWMGIDLIPYDHKFHTGSPGSIASRGANFALQNADWLLTIGARLDMAMIGYAPEKLARAAYKIMVDIDEHEIKKLKSAINLPIHADAKEFLHVFQQQVEDIKIKDRSMWLLKCREWKNKFPVVLPEHRKQKRLSTYLFSEILSEELSTDDLIAPGSSGVAVEIFFQSLKAKSGQRIIHDRGLGSMGFALPASIGACLASGRKRTISVDGDGSFQLNIQELETVARLNLPIKFFVINNHGYASIRASQQKYFGRLTGADASSGLTIPDLVKIATAYGLEATRIESPDNLRTQIRTILASPGPMICDVKIIKDEVSAPRLASIQNEDGSIVSKPLEDLWPFLDRQEFLSNMIIPPLDE
jgi:acetolactate synthase-1/2/3 large subunit